MPVLLPAVTFLALLGFLRKRFPTKKYSFRLLFLGSAVLWGCLIVLSTELFSLGQHLNFSFVCGFWLLCSVVFSAAFWLTPGPFPLPSGISLSRSEKWMLGGIAFFLAATALVAWAALPTNWDSMTYHLARVAHWQQDRSVANYPTHVLRQLTSGPFAEYVILQFSILSGTDRWAAFVQWFSMAGSVLGVSLIAAQLKASRFVQIFAAVLTVTLPMGLLEASSTQNDYVVALWTVCLVAFLFQLKKEFQWRTVLAASLSFGLAILTKGTGILYGSIVLLWFCFFYLRKYKTKLILLLLSAGVCLSLINAGFFLRNYQLSGDILARSLFHKGIVTENRSIATVYSNLLRNATLHLSTPSTKMNKGIEDTVVALHKLFGLDVFDPKTSLTKNYTVSKPQFHEDVMGNGLHVLLFLFCLLLCVCRKRLRENKEVLSYGAMIVAGILAYCLLISWQPWGARLQLALFVLSAPFLAIALCTSEKRIWPIGVAFILLLEAVPVLLLSQTRIVLARENIFNTPRQDHYKFVSKSYARLINEIHEAFLPFSSCSQIGHIAPSDFWEYPFFQALRQKNDPNYRYEDVAVKNKSAEVLSYPLGDFHPCAIVYGGKETPPRLTIGKDVFTHTHKFLEGSLFILDPTGEVKRKMQYVHFNHLLQQMAGGSNLLAPSGKNIKDQVLFMGALLQTINHMDRDTLNVIFPALGTEIFDQLGAGLQLQLGAIRTNNPPYYREGQKRITAWYHWLNNHRQGLKKIFDNF